MSKLFSLIVVLLTLGLVLSAQAQNAGTPIGRTEWTNPDASGHPPGERTSRVLAPRTRIVEREAVDTSERGAADFFFVNQSRLLVGPLCRVVLDGRFYDPELDTEVKEFSLETLLRCVTKAENILADDPKDKISIKTPRGTIVIAGAVATIALASEDAASGLPKRGNGSSAPLQVTVTAVSPGGFVSLTGLGGVGGGQQSGGAGGNAGGADNTQVVKRSGFVLWVDQSGEVRGPERETSRRAEQLRAPLLRVVSKNRRAPASGARNLRSQAYLLEDPDLIRPLNSDKDRPLNPATNCLIDSCSGLFITR